MKHAVRVVRWVRLPLGSCVKLMGMIVVGRNDCRGSLKFLITPPLNNPPLIFPGIFGRRPKKFEIPGYVFIPNKNPPRHLLRDFGRASARKKFFRGIFSLFSRVSAKKNFLGVFLRGFSRVSAKKIFLGVFLEGGGVWGQKWSKTPPPPYFWSPKSRFSIAKGGGVARVSVVREFIW